MVKSKKTGKSVGVNKQDEGLLGNLYIYLKENYDNGLTKNDLLNLLFQSSETGLTTGSGAVEFKNDVITTQVSTKLIYNRDIIIRYYETDIFNCFDRHEGLKEGVFNALKTGVSQYIDDEKFLKRLEKHNQANNYKTNKPCKQGSRTSAKILVEYYDNILKTSQNIDPETFACGLYSGLYYLEHGYVPDNYAEELNGVSGDRKEFLNEVVMKYGCSGKPGVERIYRMANREKPNTIALFEAGELEYYGKGVSSKPNYQKAYNYYTKAIEGENFNPLAGWSLGYMLYYYGDKKNPIYNADIKEIKCMKVGERIDEAVRILKKSLDCGCPAAANVLGLILRDEKIDEMIRDFLKMKYNLVNGIEYFEIASEAGYSYAKNNLYKYYAELSKCDGDENFKIAYQYIKDSAELGNTYAMNKYAKYYLIDYKNDKAGALSYLDEAAMLSEDWAAWNILDNYCDDEASLKMVKSLSGIHNEQTLFDAYIIKLINMCENSDVDDIKTKFTNWIEGKGVKWKTLRAKSKI